jgi:hypothetical protein
VGLEEGRLVQADHPEVTRPDPQFLSSGVSFVSFLSEMCGVQCITFLLGHQQLAVSSDCKVAKNNQRRTGFVFYRIATRFVVYRVGTCLLK